MLGFNRNIKIYVSIGYTDMRKGILGLSYLSNEIVENNKIKDAIFVFRGKRSDRIKILYWDGQGYCLYYKCLEEGKFIWPIGKSSKSISITRAQLEMLIEGIDWRRPVWSSPPKYIG